MNDFTFRAEWVEMLNGLPAQVKAEAFEAIIIYGSSGTLPTDLDLGDMAALAFRFIKRQIDADRAQQARRKERSAHMRELAAKRWGKKTDTNENNNEADAHAYANECDRNAHAYATAQPTAPRAHKEEDNYISSVGNTTLSKEKEKENPLQGSAKKEKETAASKPNIGATSQQTTPRAHEVTTLTPQAEADPSHAELAAQHVAPLPTEEGTGERPRGLSGLVELSGPVWSPEKFISYFCACLDHEHALIPRPKAALSPSRRAAIKARAREYGPEALLEMARRAAASPFLNGHNERSWRADIDWCLRPNNFPKIIEGNYSETFNASQHGNANNQQAPAGSHADTERRNEVLNLMRSYEREGLAH